MSFNQRQKFSKVKVLVLGGSDVGKTAFAVRYLTKRFIGEYAPNQEMLYTHHVSMDKDEVVVEIMDTAHSSDAYTMETNIKWADGFILMYSITDSASYFLLENFISQILKYHSHKHGGADDNHAQVPPPPIIVVGNKTDMSFVRKVSESEGEVAARRFDCPCFELSVAENYEHVENAMDSLLMLCKKDFIRRMASLEKKGAFTGVKKILKKKMYRSKSDTVNGKGNV